MFSNITWNACKHEIMLKATNITAFIKASGGFFYLYSPRDLEAVPLPYDEVVFCANPACERVQSKVLALGKYS